MVLSCSNNPCFSLLCVALLFAGGGSSFSEGRRREKDSRGVGLQRKKQKDKDAISKEIPSNAILGFPSRSRSIVEWDI